MPVYALLNIHFKNAPESTLNHSKSRTKARQQQHLNEARMWHTEPWETSIQSWDVLQKADSWPGKEEEEQLVGDLQHLSVTMGLACPVWCSQLSKFVFFHAQCSLWQLQECIYLPSCLLNTIKCVSLHYIGRFRPNNTHISHFCVGRQKCTRRPPKKGAFIIKLLAAISNSLCPTLTLY